MMDIVIESTRGFEKDLGRLSDEERTIAGKTINACAALFPTQKAYAYRKLHRLTLDADLNGYESSLYTLKVSQKLRVILAVDEDPIFNQVIFTLFRVVNLVDVHTTYQATGRSLYQEIAHHQQAVQAS